MRAALHPRWICVALALLLAALHGWHLGVLRPMEQKVAELEEQLTAARSEEAELARAVSALKSDTSRMDDERARMRTFLQEILGPKAESLPHTQSLLREISGKHGMDPEVIPLAFATDPSSMGVLVELGMNMKVQTAYPQLKAFLSTLAETPRLIVLNSLRLESKAAATDTLDITLGLSTWFVDAEKVKAPPVQPPDPATAGKVVASGQAALPAAALAEQP